MKVIFDLSQQIGVTPSLYHPSTSCTENVAGVSFTCTNCFLDTLCLTALVQTLWKTLTFESVTSETTSIIRSYPFEKAANYTDTVLNTVLPCFYFRGRGNEFTFTRAQLPSAARWYRACHSNVLLLFFDHQRFRRWFTGIKRERERQPFMVSMCLEILIHRHATLALNVVMEEL